MKYFLLSLVLTCSQCFAGVCDVVYQLSANTMELYQIGVKRDQLLTMGGNATKHIIDKVWSSEVEPTMGAKYVAVRQFASSERFLCVNKIGVYSQPNFLELE